MATFILTWNPKRFQWIEYDRDVERVASGEPAEDTWSVGNLRRGIDPGDRFYLMRQDNLRGVVGSGYFPTGEIYQGEHWDDGESSGEAWYTDIVFDSLVSVERRLPVEVLLEHVPYRWNNLYSSGNRMSDHDAIPLHRLWQDVSPAAEIRNPEELAAGSSYSEGSATRVEVNRYERDPRARAECVRHWGISCVACGFDFGDRYGSLGKGFIHVHHLIELSSVGADYRVDPTKDLVPLCPNCHSMVHRQRPALTPEELHQIILQSSSNSPGAGGAV